MSTQRASASEGESHRLPHSVVIRSLRRRLWKAFQEEDVKTAKRAYQASRIDFERWIQEERIERDRKEEKARLEALKSKRPSLTKLMSRSSARSMMTKDLDYSTAYPDLTLRDRMASYDDNVPILQTEMNPSEPFIADDFLSPHDSYQHPALKEIVYRTKPEVKKVKQRRPRLAAVLANFRRSEQQPRGTEERFDDQEEVEEKEDTFMTTPLHEAARLGSAEFVRYLISIGGDPNTKNGQSRTSIHMAAGGCSREEAKWLRLSKEKQKSSEEEEEEEEEKDGDYPLLGIHVQELPDNILLNPHEESEKNATGSGKNKAVKSVGKMFRTAFRASSKQQQNIPDNPEHTKSLTGTLDPKVLASFRTERMDAVLAVISWSDQENGEGPSLNSVDVFGRTALHYAAELGRDDVCLALLSNFDVMLTIVDGLSMTPCELAADQGHPDLAAQLEARAVLYTDPYGLDDELMASVLYQTDETEHTDPRSSLAVPFRWFETISYEQVRQGRINCTNETLVQIQEIVQQLNGSNEIKRMFPLSNISDDENESRSSASSDGDGTGARSEDSSKNRSTGSAEVAVTSFDGLSIGHVERLLNHHRWNMDEALKAFRLSPMKALKDAGAPLTSEPISNAGESSIFEPSSSTCLICYDENIALQDWVKIEGCAHGFCSGCFESYLSDCAASKATGLVIGCPHHECPVLLAQSQLVSFLSESPARAAVLESLAAASDEKFVTTAPDYRFCPHPGCCGVVKISKRGFLPSSKELDFLVYTGAICTACSSEEGSTSSPLSYEGVYAPGYRNCRSSTQPRRGHRFCFACGEGVHWPVSCQRLEEWHKTLAEEIGTPAVEEESHKADDIAQKLWLKANTRPCPECNVPIEKNEGCNHMTCTNPSCCHEFCWICRKDWKLHGTSTGGFFRCNIWQDDDVDGTSLGSGEAQELRPDRVPETEAGQNDDQGYGTAVYAARMAWRQKYEMARFLHHFTRWEAHKDSAALEAQMADTVCSRLAPVVEKAIDFNGFDDFNFGGKGLSFVHDAFTELLECRRMLQHSYAFSFFRYPSALKSRRNSHIPSRRKEKLRFQSIQAEVEMLTEQMSDIVARSHLRATQNQISFLTLSAAEKRKDFSLLMLSILCDEQREDSGEAKKDKDANQIRRRSGRRHIARGGTDNVRIITEDTLDALRSARAETQEVNEALRASLQDFMTRPHSMEVDDTHGGDGVSMWSCSACTFVNESGSRCAMCNTRRNA